MTQRNADHTPDAPDEPDADRSAEFEEMVATFEGNARDRNRRLLVWTVVGLVVAAGVFSGAYAFRWVLFHSPISAEDIQRGRQEIIDKTDDPQCRAMIADVQTLGDRFFQLEPTIDQKLLGDDVEAIEGILADITGIQLRLDDIEQASAEAALRFDRSRAELDDWFEYLHSELSFVNRLAGERLASLRQTDANGPNPNGDPGAESEVGDAGRGRPSGELAADSDASAADQTLVEQSSKEAADTSSDDEESPKIRKRDALIAIHEAFKSFEVWHSTELHPCGPAAADETPWRPHENPPNPK